MSRSSGGKKIGQREKRSVRLDGNGPYNGGKNSGGNTRVYVGNLSWDVSWQDLKDHMRGSGDVIRADVMSDNDGRSKGCGLVEYATEREALAAVQTLHNTELKGRLIFVREDREAQRGGGGGNQRPSFGLANRRVYVGNLSWDVAWQDLKDHMRTAGEIARADVLSDTDGRSKGCGLVEYVLSDGASRAIETLNDTELKGRLIFVREDREAEIGAGAGAGAGNRRRGPPIGSALGTRTSSNGGDGGGSNVSLSSMTGNRVYVGNLSWDVSWQDLKDYMRSAGDVIRADIMEDGGRSKGCGIIEFDSPKSAANAISELNNTMLKGRQIHVREDREELKSRLSGGSIDLGYTGGSRSGAGRQLYIRNLAFNTSWQSLKDHFKTIGDVQRVEIVMDDRGKSRGSGTVRFSNAQDALYALDTLNGSVLDDFRIDVRMDHQAN